MWIFDIDFAMNSSQQSKEQAQTCQSFKNLLEDDTKESRSISPFCFSPKIFSHKDKVKTKTIFNRIVGLNGYPIDGST